MTVICLGLALLLYGLGSSRIICENGDNIFWTDKNLSLVSLENSAKLARATPQIERAPMNRFDLCAFRSDSMNATLVSGMGLSLLICSAFFFARSFRKQDQ